MGKIYSHPESVGAPPRYDMKKSHDENVKAETEWTEKVCQWAKQYGSGQYAGEIVRFSVADGYAMYVVVSLKPVKLIHLDLGDGYDFQYIDRLSANDIRNRIDAMNKMKELFGSD